MTAYYNEHDPKKAAWLRELITAGVIASGIVDERSIEDVLPSELMGFTQCHFFAGIGIWSYALRQAGWPDDRPVWTGSCPCQPFSAAGKRAGTSDERHLWPAFYWLIQQCRPDVVFGEQVASKDGLAWLDIVQSDLEAANYAIGPLDLCAAGVGAPHIRQRLYFVAESLGSQKQSATAGRLHPESGGSGPANQLANAENSDGGSGERGAEAGVGPDGERRRGSASGGDAGILEHAAGDRRDARWPESGWGRVVSGCSTGILGNAESERQREARAGGGRSAQRTGATRSQGRRLFTADRSGDSADQCAAGQTGPTNGFWRDAEWIYCRDGKWRPTQPSISPLVNGAAERLVRSSNPSAPLDAGNTAEARTLRHRGYGDGIVAPLAVEFIRAAMEWNA